MMQSNHKKEREELIKSYLLPRGISNERVLEAFSKVDRKQFVPHSFEDMAYLDRPLPIGHDVTISQPYIVALMCELLDLHGDEKVLDIGTGSGYQAAILSLLSKQVISIERIEELADSSRARLSKLGYKNIEVIYGDGSKGYEREAPYDGIIVAATAEDITDAWKNQLKIGGKIVYPQRIDGTEILVEAIKTEEGFEKYNHGYVSFVPLIED
ncbi:MAG: protein-L-isoaspartate(D-aspartate) O-methyltransferase [Candidatus Dojkabacteria bacterium]